MRIGGPNGRTHLRLGLWMALGASLLVGLMMLVPTLEFYALDAMEALHLPGGVMAMAAFYLVPTVFLLSSVGLFALRAHRFGAG